MDIKQLYNDNLRKLPNEYGDVSVMVLSFQVLLLPLGTLLPSLFVCRNKFQVSKILNSTAIQLVLMRLTYMHVWLSLTVYICIQLCNSCTGIATFPLVVIACIML